MADGSPHIPKTFKLRPHEFRFNQAGIRQGHADGLGNEAANMERLVKLLDDGQMNLEQGRSALAAHAGEARQYQEKARNDSRVLLDQALEARPWIFVRLRAAFRALLGS